MTAGWALCYFNEFFYGTLFFPDECYFTTCNKTGLFITLMKFLQLHIWIFL